MTDDPKLLDEIPSLIRLAKRFAGRGLYDESAELFLLALKLDPENRAVKMALADVRKRQGHSTGTPLKGLKESLHEQARRDAIDASHFLGLAHLYAEKGEHAQALECLEVSSRKQEVDPAQWKLRGRILSRRKDFRGAVDALTRALRYNPFDRETAESLGRAEYEDHEFESSLKYTVHAFLLLHEGDEEGAERLRRRIQTLKQILGWGNRELGRVFRERQETLHVAFDRLEWRRERFLEEAGLPSDGLFVLRERRADRVGQIDLAGRLRQLEVWKRLSDEQVFSLTRAFRDEEHETGSEIFADGSRGRDLYVIESGQVLIQRPTSYGTIHLATLGAGSIFGEVNFLSGAERSAEALATRPARLLVADAEQLERVIELDPDLGVQLYWGFWSNLSSKLRSTNEELKRFFSAEAQTENFLQLRRRPTSQALFDQVKVDTDDKIRLFREQGLSRKELMTLATFSREKRFAAGTSIFQEGDEGREMYIILEGRVMISKFIPGGGEEALAILERGDFFGEMALIDGAPRSADARAHAGTVTVLSLDEGTVQELLSMDAAAALEFLQLLCRLITQRLREIDEKVIGWRIMSGEAGDSMAG